MHHEHSFNRGIYVGVIGALCEAQRNPAKAVEHIEALAATAKVWAFGEPEMRQMVEGDIYPPMPMMTAPDLFLPHPKENDRDEQ